jgi:proline iminopeptidase
MIEMNDGARLRIWTSGSVIPQRLPLVMVHGGPGVPDYLGPVAGIIDDLCLVHRYDQRGTGGSRWEGEHTIGRHVQDLASLLDGWGHDRVVLMGHSFGTDMASYFLLAHPERVAGLIQLAGPFLYSWRDADLAAQRVRRSGDQQARLGELDAIESRTDAEEIEYLALSWFTDHADVTKAWDWALAAARTLRPINYPMNAQLNAAKKADPLESRVDELRELLPPGAVIVGGAGDTRPADALRHLGARLNCEVIIIPDAGHEPWLEAPDQFGAVLRAAVRRQTLRLGSEAAVRFEQAVTAGIAAEVAFALEDVQLGARPGAGQLPRGVRRDAQVDPAMDEHAGDRGQPASLPDQHTVLQPRSGSWSRRQGPAARRAPGTARHRPATACSPTSDRSAATPRCPGAHATAPCPRSDGRWC